MRTERDEYTTRCIQTRFSTMYEIDEFDICTANFTNTMVRRVREMHRTPEFGSVIQKSCSILIQDGVVLSPLSTISLKCSVGYAMR